MSKKPPPPLPPRQKSSLSIEPPEDAPPSYDSIMISQPSMAGPWNSEDPRSSSMQSLVPSASDEQNDRRKLLLIYIHGFMGNETSFRSFPAHVHHILMVLLAETHVVHTKIYPRYRSKRNISFTRDDFSRWLEPHEDFKTDVVLLGHSMGGLVSAEVALMPAPPPASRPLNHRILGTINFDVPFLGMHPGIIRSGLASIFMPSEQTHQDHYFTGTESGPSDGVSPRPARSDTLWTSNPDDPNYNPAFNNDVILPVRKGWESAWHFISKHSSNLTDFTEATKKLVSSHMEFGGAMANYGELRTRYAKIRALEEEDGNVRKSVVGDGGVPPRVRFVNYYTASTGILKPPKQPQPAASEATKISNADSPLTTSSEDAAAQGTSKENGSVPSKESQTSSSPFPVDEHREDGAAPKQPAIEDEDFEDEDFEDEDWEMAAETLTLHDPRPIEDDVDEQAVPPSTASAALPPSPSTALSPSSTLSMANSSTLSLTASLPPIPEPPTAPPPLDVSYIEDAETRKLVEKEHSRAVKAYEKAVKDREKTIKDRAKLEEKRERKAQKDAEKAEKDAQKAKQKGEAERAKQLEKNAKREREQAKKELTHAEKEEARLEKERQRMEAEARRMRGEPELPKELDDEDERDGESLTETVTSSSTKTDGRSKAQAPPKDRKFCVLPPKDSNGQRDPCWVRVFMENVDEVGAHCGLFFVDERYERLVGDVAERIEGWVRESNDERILLRMHSPRSETRKT